MQHSCERGSEREGGREGGGGEGGRNVHNCHYNLECKYYRAFHRNVHHYITITRELS